MSFIILFLLCIEQFLNHIFSVLPYSFMIFFLFRLLIIEVQLNSHFFLNFPITFWTSHVIIQLLMFRFTSIIDCSLFCIFDYEIAYEPGFFHYDKRVEKQNSFPFSNRAHTVSLAIFRSYSFCCDNNRVVCVMYFLVPFGFIYICSCNTLASLHVIS